MLGCHKPRSVLFLLPLLLAILAGCEEVRPGSEDESSPDPEAGSAFDSQTAGVIRGQVVWKGEPPRIAPIEARYSAKPHIVLANPNALAIHPQGGVAEAVVFLRDVDPRRARPWDQPPVRVQQRDYRLTIHQGSTEARCGFVRRGASIEMVSMQPVCHALRARGAAFFTLSFPDTDQPLSRSLEQRGIVELSSAAEYYWMRAYLFVDDHPYYVRTDAEGRFALEGVPPGRYRLVCWHPNWHKQRQARNPETAEVMRWDFRPSVEIVQPVVLGVSEVRKVQIVLSEELFEGERRIAEASP